jgi:hypothetical protein
MQYLPGTELHQEGFDAVVCRLALLLGYLRTRNHVAGGFLGIRLREY